MPQRETLLEAAAFLDSPHAKTLGAHSRHELHGIVEKFLDCSFDGVGKAPRHLDGEDIHHILGHLLPAKFAKKDPAAMLVPDVLRAYLAFLEERAIVSQAYEVRAAIEANLPHFRGAVESGRLHEHGAPSGPLEKPFVHRADKVGRNDPCPCGSGKKFKQCCAKLGT
jgi:hypothetical protein